MQTMPKADLRSRRQTILWVRNDPSSQWRVLNIIDFSSKFQSVPRTSSSGYDMNLHENQLSVARELRDGWRTNGPWPFAEFRIQQYNEFGQFIHGE